MPEFENAQFDLINCVGVLNYIPTKRYKKWRLAEACTCSAVFVNPPPNRYVYYAFATPRAHLRSGVLRELARVTRRLGMVIFTVRTDHEHVWKAVSAAVDMASHHAFAPFGPFIARAKRGVHPLGFCSANPHVWIHVHALHAHAL